MDQTFFFWLDKLKELLRILSTEPSIQIAYLERLGTSPSLDELALELDDLMWVLDQGEKNGLLKNEFVLKVRRIEEIFDAMSDACDKSVWSVKSLGTAKEWGDIRNLARELLLSEEAKESEKGSQ